MLNAVTFACLRTFRWKLKNQRNIDLRAGKNQLNVDFVSIFPLFSMENSSITCRCDENIFQPKY